MKKEEKEAPKEIGFVTVLNILAGIIIAVFCLITLIDGLFLSGILFLILTVFIFLPQKVLRFNKWLKLLIVVVGFFIVMILVGFNVPSPEPEFTSHNLNEEFMVSYNNINFSMIIYNVTKEKTILVEGEERTTNGIFILVHGSITNLGHVASDFSFSSGLLDNQNNSFTTLFFSMDEGATQPDLKKDFIDIYETPVNTTGLKLVVVGNANTVRRIELGI